MRHKLGWLWRASLVHVWWPPRWLRMEGAYSKDLRADASYPWYTMKVVGENNPVPQAER